MLLLLDEEAANFDGGTGAGNVRKDLSEWQERHATLVLSKVKVFFFNPISQFGSRFSIVVGFVCLFLFFFF